MLTNSSQLKCHLFICTNCTYKTLDVHTGLSTESDPKEALMFRKKIKDICAEKFGKETVKITGANCLGKCDHGISAIHYPKGEWVLNLKGTETDSQKIIDLIQKQLTSI